jgi:hypothetical protein
MKQTNKQKKNNKKKLKRFLVLEGIFQKNMLKGKSSSFDNFSSTLTCPSSNILSQH